MAAHLFKRYVWLLEQISKGGKTFNDISRAWEYSSLNDKPGTPLPKRTFNNHIEEIKEMFGLRSSVNDKVGISMFWRITKV